MFNVIRWPMNGNPQGPARITLWNMYSKILIFQKMTTYPEEPGGSRTTSRVRGKPLGLMWPLKYFPNPSSNSKVTSLLHSLKASYQMWVTNLHSASYISRIRCIYSHKMCAGVSRGPLQMPRVESTMCGSFLCALIRMSLRLNSFTCLYRQQPNIFLSWVVELHV